MRVEVAFSFDDRPDDARAFFERIGSLDVVKGGSEFTIDFEKCLYLGPVGVACVSGVYRYLRNRHVDVRIIPPKLNRLLGYCGWSGLLQLTNIGPGPTAHRDNVTIPVREFATFDQEGIDQVVSLVNRFIPMTEGTESVLRQCIAELIQNILDHSRSTVGGFMSAKAFKGQNTVKLAIYDMGIGVYESIRPRYTHIRTDEEALRIAFTAGGSAKTFERNQGMGLKYLNEIVASNRGLLALYSGSSCAVREGGRRIAFRGTPPDVRIPGTLAIMHFRIANRLYSGGSEPAGDIEV
jgi:hypothetical protein